MNNIEKYVKYSLKAYKGQEDGSSRVFDYNHRKMRKVAREMYKNGKIGELKPLLHYEHDAVRCDVAIQLLPFYTGEAESVLEELALKRGNLTYSTARMTLEEWRKREFWFPEYEE